MNRQWRTGRKVGRTLYRQLGPEPSDDDPLIGVMDTPELATRAINHANVAAALDDEIAHLCDALRDCHAGLPVHFRSELTDALERHGIEIAGVNAPDSPEAP